MNGPENQTLSAGLKKPVKIIAHPCVHNLVLSFTVSAKIQPCLIF
jgi:hypothetical protein